MRRETLLERSTTQPLPLEGYRVGPGAYADRLDEHGEIDAHHFPSLCHGFYSLTGDASRADAAFDEVAASVRTRIEAAPGRPSRR
ncbi:MAG: hypothetical protein V5A62_18785 [Haloarculaceae archaeon]